MCRQTLGNEVPEAGNPLYLAIDLNFTDAPPNPRYTTTARKMDIAAPLQPSAHDGYNIGPGEGRKRQKAWQQR
jgi:hypothetical protein